MSLQPDAKTSIDRGLTTPFLLRLYWRQNRSIDPHEFSVAPPPDTSGIIDYSSLLPSSIRSQSVQIYTWPNCTLGELTALFTSVLPPSVIPSPAIGTRLVFNLVFPDTRATTYEGGRGRFIGKPLGSVVIGGNAVEDSEMRGNDGGDDDEDEFKKSLSGDSEKALSDARFVIGDYVVCSIYPPDRDGRVAPMPAYSGGGGGRGMGSSMPRRDGPPMSMRDGGNRRGGGGGYRGGYGRDGLPPSGEWRRGERPPGGGGGGGGGRGGPRRPWG